MTIPLKLTMVGKNHKGADDEKEYLEATADRFACIGDVYYV